jgi:hypothetical protein
VSAERTDEGSGLHCGETQNPRAHGVDIAPHVLIRKPHDIESHAHQVLRAVAVGNAAFVLRAIELDDRLGFETDEVGNVAALRPLAAKLQPAEFPVT